MKDSVSMSAIANFFTQNSHRGWTQCFCQHPRELLLRLCSMLCILLSDRLLLLPVSRWSISVLFVSSRMKRDIKRIEELTLFRETKQKTLEEVAAAFGDRVVDQDEGAKRAVSVVGETQHIESTHGTTHAV